MQTYLDFLNINFLRKLKKVVKPIICIQVLICKASKSLDVSLATLSLIGGKKIYRLLVKCPLYPAIACGRETSLQPRQRETAESRETRESDCPLHTSLSQGREQLANGKLDLDIWKV